MSTPSSDQALLDKKPVNIDLAKTDRLMLHNRIVHDTSGCFMILPNDNLADLSIIRSGDYVGVNATPKSSDGWLSLILGDWVREHYKRKANALWTEKSTPNAWFDAFSAQGDFPVKFPENTDFTDLETILAQNPDLAQKHQKALQNLKNTLKSAQNTQKTPSGAARVKLMDQLNAFKQLSRDIRADAFKTRSWLK